MCQVLHRHQGCRCVGNIGGERVVSLKQQISSVSRLFLALMVDCSFKAVKTHSVSKGLATPTNPSTIRTLEKCGLYDVIRGLSIVQLL